MTGPTDNDADGFEPIYGGRIDLQDLPPLARYSIAFFLAAAATILAFALQGLVSAPNVALMYVLPVVLTASYCGWGASLFAVALSVLAFDFFFTEPYYSLAMTNPPEIWAAVLLLVIATLVASVAADARRRALEATATAERAAALQVLAHTVVHAQASVDVMKVAAVTLQRLFQAPCIIFMQQRDTLDVAASAGGARTTEKDHEAARGALENQICTRGGTYPYDQSYFDFWPVKTAKGGSYVLGVDFAHAARERPAATEELIEAVAGYLAASSTRSRTAESSLAEIGKA